MEFKVGNKVEYSKNPNGWGWGINGNVGDKGVVIAIVDCSYVMVKRDDGEVEQKHVDNIKLLSVYKTTKIENFPGWLKGVPRDESVECWTSDRDEIPDENNGSSLIFAYCNGKFWSTGRCDWAYATPIEVPVVDPVKEALIEELEVAEEHLVMAREEIEEVKVKLRSL